MAGSQRGTEETCGKMEDPLPFISRSHCAHSPARRPVRRRALGRHPGRLRLERARRRDEPVGSADRRPVRCCCAVRCGVRCCHRGGRRGRGIDCDLHVPARDPRASDDRHERRLGRPRRIRRARHLCAHRVQRRHRRAARLLRIRRGDRPARADLSRQPHRSDPRLRDAGHARGRRLPAERPQRR